MLLQKPMDAPRLGQGAFFLASSMASVGDLTDPEPEQARHSFYMD